ncbi:MAG: glycoside hydrolase domain-containing protein [Bacteroides thetaiotaomicron]
MATKTTGSTSAWYVFSALGFYPVCPGTDEVYHRRSVIQESHASFWKTANSLVIDAPNNSKKNFYVNFTECQWH